MKILVIGQCTLHWGRMEFGNIGNYYIIEPFFRELHRCFPNADIRTTMQMSERFCRQENVTSVPLDLYYAWRDNELELAMHELRLSEAIKNTGSFNETTPYLEAVKWADLVIDFSGDIWGDNADFLGPDRFEVGLVKNMVAQNIGKPTALIAGSPGPFSNPRTLELAKQVYAGFNLVTNREAISSELLAAQGFSMSKTIDLACPAFLFEPETPAKMAELLRREGLDQAQRSKPIVGFILCGWNFERGPFDLWPRADEDYTVFADNVEFIVGKLGARVCLMSHSNGFDVPPLPFELKHGRDYPIAKQLQSVLKRRNVIEDVFCLDGVYDAWQTKAIVGSFDMMVSGRVHAAVAALSQSVPTVIIDYGHEPKAHKLLGFARVAGVEHYVADPTKDDDLNMKIVACWECREKNRSILEQRVPSVKQQAQQHFKILARVLQ